MARKVRAKAQLPPSVLSSSDSRSLRKLVTLQSTSSIATESVVLPDLAEGDLLVFKGFQELQEAYKSSPFHNAISSSKSTAPVVERYSDKYKLPGNSTKLCDSTFVDPRGLPEELLSVFSISSTPKKKSSDVNALDRIKNFVDVAEEDSDEKEDDEMGLLGEEEEDELEDDNDYSMSYFDNGEDTGDYNDGGADEGPTY